MQRKRLGAMIEEGTGEVDEASVYDHKRDSLAGMEENAGQDQKEERGRDGVISGRPWR